MSNSGETARSFPSARSVSQIESVATFVAASALGPQTSPLLSVQDVEVAFTTRKGLFRTGEVRALNGVSLDLARGETVALVGESGSGKTTLGRVSLRLTKPTAGRIIYDGRDITETDDSDLHWFRKRAQIVFQDPFSSLNPYMRVYDLVEEPLVIDGVSGRDERLSRVERALEAVELVPVRRFGEKFPNMMSGGQRQRVGIARALVRDPEYIVADEPVSMIDASSRIEILDLLRGLQDTRGVAFLYITHDIASARHFADRIAVMYQGTIVELGPAGVVIDNPLHPYTKALIAAIPEPDPRNRFHHRAVVPGEPISGGPVPPGCPFFSRCPDRIPGLCDVQRPALTEYESGHFVACHRYL
ncbi:MAG: peptide/nickel transport system ATP-binding protein ddpF [Thermomicrobiales bacterium]|nr:peptide/nickel transport system ATP-binding protein ddpF [Thermomicrobiales bacterium]